jgi:hypothetical protein
MPRRSLKKMRRFSRHKGRRGSRRRMQGGWRNLSPANVNDASMDGPMNMSLKQGGEYSVLHEGQHGGGTPLVGSPAFQTQVLPASLVTAARTGETLQAFREIQGMSDQAGGANYNSGDANNSKGGGRRRRKSRGRRRKSRGRRRRQGGGAHEGADVSSPSMLLSGNSARHAEGGMNPEWQLAKNPSAFVPK